MALHVILARLTPAERTAYVLHDVFKYSFDDIAEIVGRSLRAGRVHHIHGVIDPAKLADLNVILDP